MITIRPMDTRHLEQAARLFSAKYRPLWDENKLLPPKFAEASAIEPLLRGVNQEHPGVVALKEGRVVGYLTGYSGIPAFKGHATGVYVPAWGHCVDAVQDTSAIYPALYAELSAQWVARQCPTHAISYFVPDRALEELLFGLGFGLLVIDGIRALSPVTVAADNGCGVSAADESDLADLAELDGRLAAHVRGAPVFLNFDSTQNDELAQQFLGEATKTFIARQNGRAIAAIRGRLNMGPGCDLFDEGGSLGIDFAYTDPSARGQGVATRLLNELIRWGAAQGMTRCVVDFESANLLAKGFWLRHFQPICHSAIRRVDERM